MRATLGVTGTQRYLPDTNIIPSINAGVRQFNALVQGLTLAERKGSEELLREITYLRVFQTNDLGGVVLDEAQLGHKVWSINAVYPRPVTEPADAQPLPIPADQSQWRNDVTVRRPGKYRGARITLEQAPDTEMSKFMPGSEKMANSLMPSFAYYIVGDRTTDNWVSGGAEIVVLPESIMGKKLVGISYMKGVDPITSLNDNIPYPAIAFKMLQELSLNEISIRQGARPLYEVTLQQLRELINAQA